MATELLSCETCAYHKPRSKTEEVWYAHLGISRSDTRNWIECHRYPPVVLVMRDGQVEQHVPEVEADHMCGEWSATFK